ncbi:fimbrial protein [Frateuria aurantia]
MSDRRSGRWTTGLACLLWLLWLLPAHRAWAVSCTQGSPQTVTLANVSVPASTAVGSLLGTPASATMTFTCKYGILELGNVSIQAGGPLAPLDASNSPAGPGIVFSTNLPGIAVKVTGSPTPTSSQVCASCGPNGSQGFQVGTVTNPSLLLGGTGRLDETFTLQLVKTGNIVPGTLTGIILMPFWWTPSSGSGSTLLNMSLILGAGTQITVPACTVNAPADFTVVLPTVSTSALAAVGATAGRTGFHLSLDCPANTRVAVSMLSSLPSARVIGLSNPAAGGAANVGVQLLDSHFAPVNMFGVPQASVVTTVQGTLLLTYYAQYYLAAAGAGAGRVSASVTYTLTYP